MKRGSRSGGGFTFRRNEGTLRLYNVNTYKAQKGRQYKTQKLGPEFTDLHIRLSISHGCCITALKFTPRLPPRQVLSCAERGATRDVGLRRDVLSCGVREGTATG